MLSVEGPLSTATLASHLTWKQSDILVFLDRINDNDPYPRRGTHEISEFLTYQRHDDELAGRVYYWGTDYGGIYSTLKGMERRGLVIKDYQGLWRLTINGQRAAYDLS